MDRRSCLLLLLTLTACLMVSLGRLAAEVRGGRSVDAPTLLRRLRRTHTSAPRTPPSTDAAEEATAASTCSHAEFGEGQSNQARESVQMAIARQRAPVEGVLWANVQSSMAQAERESDNVRRLLQADGMPSWQPDCARLPPQLPANASMDLLLQHVPLGGHAWLGFGNSGVTEMLFNWVHHLVDLGVGWQMVVAAFDEPLLRELRRRRIPAYNYSGALPATHFRHAPYLFHRMGFLKAELITHVLRTGRHALVSDSDVVWVRTCNSMTSTSRPAVLWLVLEHCTTGSLTYMQCSCLFKRLSTTPHSAC